VSRPAARLVDKLTLVRQGHALNLEEYRRMFEAEGGSGGMQACARSASGCRDDARAWLGRRILDAGCGTGRNLLHFSRRGRGVGIDCGGGAAFLPHARCRRGARTLLELPFRDGA
jgi:SAM-dependent methyltransferase